MPTQARTATERRGGVRAPLAALIATALIVASLGGCGLPVTPANVDFGGTGASHGRP